MKKLKKLVSSLLAVSLMALCLTAIPANAAIDVKDCTLYYNYNGVSKTSDTVTIKANKNNSYVLKATSLTKGCNIRINNGSAYVNKEGDEASFTFTTTSTYANIPVALGNYNIANSTHGNSTIYS